MLLLARIQYTTMYRTASTNSKHLLTILDEHDIARVHGQDMASRGLLRTRGKPCLPKQLDVAGLAVGIVAVLLEGPLVEQLEAEGASEVLRVPLLAHCRDALACRGGGRGREERGRGEEEQGRDWCYAKPYIYIYNNSSAGHITG